MENFDLSWNLTEYDRIFNLLPDQPEHNQSMELSVHLIKHLRTSPHEPAFYNPGNTTQELVTFVYDKSKDKWLSYLQGVQKEILVN